MVDIKVEAGDDVEYAVVNVFGGTLYGPLTGRHFRTARQRMSPIYGWDSPSFLVVRQRLDREQTVRVKSTVPLERYADPDDGRELKIGVTVAGVFDTPVDVDRYTQIPHLDKRKTSLAPAVKRAKPESTEGVGRVSILKRQEGAPLNLG